MNGIKVIDVGGNPRRTQFGTCELCFSYGLAVCERGGVMDKDIELLRELKKNFYKL